MDEEKLLAILEQILNKITNNNSDENSFVKELAMRLYANTNFDLEKTSEHEVAQKCIKRAKILSDALKG